MTDTRTGPPAAPATGTSDTRLGRAIGARRSDHPGENGVLAIDDPRESFATRAVPASVAERTLDVQYPLWHDDTTGKLLLKALREAAERGVRVRLLLDDNGIAIDAALAGIEAVTDTPEAGKYLDAISAASYVTSPDERVRDFVWADVRMVSDDPAKGLGARTGTALPIGQLDEVPGRPEKSLRLVSACFVPGEKGTRAFAALAERGVEVSVLTNAMESTDVIAVRAGYAKRGKPLLAAGVRLFEKERLSGGTRHGSGTGPFGSSASGLHTKTFAIDGERGDPYWLDRSAGAPVRLDAEPGAGLARRLVVAALGKLPIDWLFRSPCRRGACAGHR